METTAYQARFESIKRTYEWATSLVATRQMTTPTRRALLLDAVAAMRRSADDDDMVKKGTAHMVRGLEIEVERIDRAAAGYQ